MMGGLGILTVGLAIGVAIAWVLPGLLQLLPSVAARAAPQAQEPVGEHDAVAGPKNNQPRLVKLDADVAVRVRHDGSRDGDPKDYGAALNRSQGDAGRLDDTHVVAKNLGNPVEKKEVLAILESREIAEAKSEYAAVQVTNESQQELFERDKALWDKNPRLGGVREGGSPVGEHPFARFSRNSFWRGLAMVSWSDFFESKRFGASFTGLVSVATLQMAGVNSHSTFALTLLIVIGYWLVIDKPRN